MAMADEHGVDLFRGDPRQEPWDGRVAEVEKKPEPVVLDEETAARLAGRRPCTAPAENREPHLRNGIDARGASRGRRHPLCRELRADAGSCGGDRTARADLADVRALLPSGPRNRTLSGCPKSCP